MRYGKGFPIRFDYPSDLEHHSVKGCDGVNFKGNLRAEKKKLATEMVKSKHGGFYFSDNM
jgi:hypothetical protein